MIGLSRRSVRSYSEDEIFKSSPSYPGSYNEFKRALNENSRQFPFSITNSGSIKKTRPTNRTPHRRKKGR